MNMSTRSEHMYSARGRTGKRTRHWFHEWGGILKNPGMGTLFRLRTWVKIWEFVAHYVDLIIHDTRHLFTRLRTNGIEAMPRGFSGGEQEKIPMQEIAVEFVYFRQTKLKNFFLSLSHRSYIVNKAYRTDFFPNIWELHSPLASLAICSSWGQKVVSSWCHTCGTLAQSWKVLKFLCYPLKSPWNFFNFDVAAWKLFLFLFF